MSRSATTPNTTKRSHGNSSSAAAGGFAANGGSAAPIKSAGNTKEVLTLSPLQAALVSQKVGLESLPDASTPFLIPIAEQCLKEFATFFYAEDKAKGTKSIPNYVASSAKKLNIVLTTESSVQESQAFTTLRNNLTAELEDFRIRVTREYVIVAADITVGAKKARYHACICKWIRGLAKVSLAQQGILNYNEDVVVMDLLDRDRDALLVPIGMSVARFLAIYKKANKLPYLPPPTVDCDFQHLIDICNGAPPPPNDGEDVIVVQRAEENEDEEMVNMVNALLAEETIGGRTTLLDLIQKTYIDSIITPLEVFHEQIKKNDEVKRIKAAFTSARLNDTAERVADVIGREPPAQQPVLRGLIDETTSKKTAAMERKIKSLEDKLDAISSKAKKVNGGGMKTKSILRKGTPIAKKSSAPPESIINRETQKKLANSTLPKDRVGNNNGSARGKGKKNGKGRKVSFAGKKADTRTNSRK